MLYVGATMRRTKIIATIGPASSSPDVLRQMIDAGLDVARIGLAHGSLDDAMERYHLIRSVAAESDRPVGVLIDLPGPKIRVSGFTDGGVVLENDSTVELRAGSDPSTAKSIHIEYESLIEDVRPGDVLPFGDGQVVVQVQSIDGDAATARVTTGGPLQGRPGLLLPSERVSMPTPTDEDLHKLDAFVEEGVDMVAVSFVRSAHDVRRVGTEPHPRGPLVIAKIETKQAVDNLAGIIEASAGIMVARGDLGTECNLEELPHLQKQIIRDCIAGGLPVITATQMLDSMVQNPTPTRAEASDVANAVFDGTSAVMLSAETAIGQYPVETIRTMAKIARRADEEFDYDRWARTVAEIRTIGPRDPGEAVTDALTMAAWRAADQLGVAAIICISGSGYTVRSTARFRPNAPLLGMSTNERTVRQLTLSWGVTPLLLEPEWSYEFRVNKAIEVAKAEGEIRSGDLVAVLAGISADARSTDVLRCMRVP